MYQCQCVFPNAIIPQRVWSAPAKSLLKYIPLPNAGDTEFSTGTQGQRVRDDKTSFRLDYNAGKWGELTGYYFFDDFSVNNPYPTGQGGASVPGFNALNTGRAQLINLGETKTIGTWSKKFISVSCVAQTLLASPWRSRPEPCVSRLCYRYRA